MLLERAVVLDYKSGIATVACSPKSACNGCSAQAKCGASVLSELTANTERFVIDVETITPVAIGQQVEIALPESTLLHSINLVYILPLCAILISTIIGSQLFSYELFTALFVLISTILSFFSIHFYVKKRQKKSAYQPILVRII